MRILGFFIVLSSLCIFLFNNCTQSTQKSIEESKPNTVQSVTLPLPVSLRRVSSSQFEVLVPTNALPGFVVSDLTMEVTNASASSWTLKSSNLYSSLVTTTLTSGEIPLVVRWKDYSANRTALILKSVGSNWDQPEAVPGLVNTFGWEDSPEISPDGQFLAVSSYSPTSIFCCIKGADFNAIAPGICPGAVGNNLATNPSCNINFYAESIKARPNFPGASRILSPTSISHSISYYDPPDTTNAYPPLSAYVFKRQEDGSFADPVAVYVDWDSQIWGAPFGFHFKNKISAKKYQMLLSFGDPILMNGNQLQSVDMDFSAPIVNMGTISRVGGTLAKSNWKMNPLNFLSFTNQGGNPASIALNTNNGYVFWDDESLPDGQRDLYFATETNGVLGAKQTLGMSQNGVDELQPFFFQNKMYYSMNHAAIFSYAMAIGSNPANSGSWSSFQSELEIDANQMLVPGSIMVIGEPSLHQDNNGKNWLYFAYGVRSPQGLNLNIGRVPAK